MEDFISYAKSLMDKSINYLIEQYKLVKVGRPNPAILDKVFIDYYGSKTPLPQVASISIEGRSMIVKPWDASILSSIDKEIQKENLGVNPQNDGDKIRLNFPPLTSEEREKVSKQASELAENSKIAIRNSRQEVKSKIASSKKSKEISDDDAKSAESKLQDLTNSYNKKIDSIKEAKINEIMEV